MYLHNPINYCHCLHNGICLCRYIALWEECNKNIAHNGLRELYRVRADRWMVGMGWVLTRYLYKVPNLTSEVTKWSSWGFTWVLNAIFAQEKKSKKGLVMGKFPKVFSDSGKKLLKITNFVFF